MAYMNVLFVFSLLSPYLEKRTKEIVFDPCIGDRDSFYTCYNHILFCQIVVKRTKKLIYGALFNLISSTLSVKNPSVKSDEFLSR